MKRHKSMAIDVDDSKLISGCLLWEEQNNNGKREKIFTSEEVESNKLHRKSGSASRLAYAH
jgi:hypothetical protein